MADRARRNIPDIERKAIFKAWNNTCAYCETNPAEAVDHIVPFAKGGACDLENFAAACNRCNLRKSANELGEGYLQIILAIAANKAVSIRENIAKEKRAKTPKAIKIQKPKQDYIKSNCLFDWTTRHTEVLHQLVLQDEDTLTTKIHSDEVNIIIYAFNVLIKQGDRSFTPLNSCTQYEGDEFAELEIRKDGLPFLRLCADKMIKAQEIILL